MPGKVKVRVLAARNLPIMDRSAETTDGFAELKLGDTTYKTDVCRKSLNPQWNSEWFRFDCDDKELQDEPLQIRIMDYDTYTANDAIGKVYIDLNPLLVQPTNLTAFSSASSDLLSVKSSRSGGSMLSGWFPVYDTLQGIRGEVKIVVKVELFSDLNKFRQSSCGVHFFCSSGVPEGYEANCINGFVEELVVNDDPEYQWIDKLRTPRASNEARQLLFMKLSGAVQRKIGLKALGLGANAVVGYQQRFDVEGDTGIVVRGIGTAITLVRRAQETLTNKLFDDFTLNQRDIEIQNVSPKGTGFSLNRFGVLSESSDLLEYPFITMNQFPPNFIFHLGGFVSARSVKLLDDLEEDSVSRESWWLELRREVRSHAKALHCNLIIGYSEETNIWENVVILCASGTAAAGNLRMMLDLESSGIFGPPFIHSKQTAFESPCNFNEEKKRSSSYVTQTHTSCSKFHVTYGENTFSFPVILSVCKSCHQGMVPDVLLTTIEPPSDLEIIGKGSLLQAKVVKFKKESKGENHAKEISDAFPFLEYEIHRQLINKLKVKGMNSVFGLKIKISLSSRMICGLATGTAVIISALPLPIKPKICLTESESIKNIEEPWKKKTQVQEVIPSTNSHVGVSQKTKEEESSSEEEENDFDDSPSNTKDTYIIEMHDDEEIDVINSLHDPLPYEGFHFYNTEEPLGFSHSHVIHNSQTFAQVWRGKIPSSSSKDFGISIQNLLSLISFKLRSFRPCIIVKLSFQVDYDDENELQLIVYGTAISMVQKLSQIHKGNDIIKFIASSLEGHAINITPLSYIPGAVIDKYLGNLNFFLIKESSSVRENGGINSFLGTCISEAFAIVRAHVVALSGNGLVGFFISEYVISKNLHRNHAQCLIHVGGDAIHCTYHSESSSSSTNN